VGIELTESGYLDTNTHFQKLWDGLKKNGVLDIEINGGGTLQSEVGIHRLVNYTILQESET